MNRISKNAGTIKLKSPKKNGAKYFFSSFISALCLTLCPFVLILGIVISDYNTRMTGLSDEKPVIYYESGDGFSLHVMGYEFSVSSDMADSLKRAAESILSFVPPQLRILAAIPDAADSLFQAVCGLFSQPRHTE